MKRLLLAACVVLLAAANYPACAAKAIKNATITISLGSELETWDPHTHTSALTTTMHR